MRLGTAAADLLLGAGCPGCRRPASGLCAECWRSIAPSPRQVPGHALTTAASGEHVDVLRDVIVAWKEDGRTGLDRVLAHHLAASVAVLPARRPVALVPVPTSARSRRTRGRDVVDDLARRSARLLTDAGVDVVVRRSLRVVRATADQSGLGARARARNLAGAFGLRSDEGLAGREIVVVDDVVTTGATLQEAARVLSAAHRRPAAAAVIATRPRGC